MIRDMLTVARKEWKESLFSGSGLKGGRMGILVMLVVFGVVLPANSGLAWITSPALLVAWAWVPLMLISGVVADSFAGERERHTLETLLASRLSDESIWRGELRRRHGLRVGPHDGHGGAEPDQRERDSLAGPRHVVPRHHRRRRPGVQPAHVPCSPRQRASSCRFGRPRPARPRRCCRSA